VTAGVVSYMLLCWGGVVFAGLFSLTSTNPATYKSIHAIDIPPNLV